MDRRWLNWLGRLVGVFPFVELRGNQVQAFATPSSTPSAETSSIKADIVAQTLDDMMRRFDSPRSWTTDFSEQTRLQARGQRILLRRSTGWLCYSMVVATCVISYTLHMTFRDFLAVAGDSSAQVSRSTDAYVAMAEYVSLCTATVTTVLCAWLCRGSVIRHAELLAEVDELLGLPPQRPQRWMGVWLTAMLAVLVTDKTVWLEAGMDLGTALDDVPLYMTYYTCFVAETLFMSDTRAVRSRIAAINQVLKDASPRPGFRDALGTPVMLPGSLSVSRLAIAYALLGRAMEAVSRRYGAPLLCDMLALLLNLVITSFLFLEHILPHAEPPDNYSRMSMEFVFACTHFSRIVMLVEQHSGAAREVDNTGVLVGYLGSTVPYGSAMYEQLRGMSVQLLHQKGSFSSCGLLELDRSIIVSIVGAVATYLLVLLQLKPSATSSKSPPSKGSSSKGS